MLRFLRPSRRHPGSVAMAFSFILLLASLRQAGAQDYSPDDMILAPSYEAPSPEGLMPEDVEPGTSEVEEKNNSYVPLFRLTQPYYNSLFAVAPPDYLLPSDSATFRPVTAYEPPIALLPRVYKQGLLQIYPWVGLSQSYDSNVNLAST